MVDGLGNRFTSNQIDSGFYLDVLTIKTEQNSEIKSVLDCQPQSEES